jgi:hypothetical protein
MTSSPDASRPTDAQIIQEIRDDVTQGLTRLKLSPGIVTIEYEDTGPVFSNGNGRYAVAWTCEAANSEPSRWYQPTGRALKVEGMSVLWPTGTGWMHRRFIDWNGVISQLGGSRGRRSVNELPAKLVTLPDLDAPTGV